MSTIIAVTTASGRRYEIDMDAKTYTRTGDADDIDFTTFGRIPERTNHPFQGVAVNDLGRLVIVEPDGQYLVTTRIVDGLDELLTALDGGAA